MDNKLYTILILSSLLPVTVIGSPDVYTLALQKCNSSSPFTLHGLWPEWGEYCKGPKFDVNAIRSIESQMDVAWLSCPQYSDTNIEFWDHEWTKHGSCSNMTELDYFSAGLASRKKYMGTCDQSEETCQICLTRSLTPC